MACCARRNRDGLGVLLTMFAISGVVPLGRIVTLAFANVVVLLDDQRS